MKHSINRSINHEEKANTALTAALEDLEDGLYATARRAATRCLTYSESVEQRLAALYVIHLASTDVSHDKELAAATADLVKATLDIAYATAE